MSDFDLSAELVDAFSPEEGLSSDIVQGVVVSKDNTAGTLYTITVQGGTVGLPARSLVPLVAGDTVWVVRKGKSLLVINHQDTGWHSLSFGAGWSDYGGVFSARYKKVSGVVHIEGIVTGGATGTVIATLPAGYRPGREVMRTMFADFNVIYRVDIDTAGQIVHVNQAVGTARGTSWQDISTSFIAEN